MEHRSPHRMAGSWLDYFLASLAKSKNQTQNCSAKVIPRPIEKALSSRTSPKVPPPRSLERIWLSPPRAFGNQRDFSSPFIAANGSLRREQKSGESSNCIMGWTESGLHRVVLVFCGINMLPVTAFDTLADLRRRLAFARLFVGIQRLSHAHVAH